MFSSDGWAKRQLDAYLDSLDEADDYAAAIESAKDELRDEWRDNPAAAVEVVEDYVFESIPNRVLELVLRGDDIEAGRLIRNAIKDCLESRIQDLAEELVGRRRLQADRDEYA